LLKKREIIFFAEKFQKETVPKQQNYLPQIVFNILVELIPYVSKSIKYLFHEVTIRVMIKAVKIQHVENFSIIFYFPFLGEKLHFVRKTSIITIFWQFYDRSTVLYWLFEYYRIIILETPHYPS
jgi:hypothetical protein